MSSPLTATATRSWTGRSGTRNAGYAFRRGPRRVRGQIRALVTVGILAFLAFCVALAPASLVAPALERIPGATLKGTAGTVWNGSGQLRLQGQNQGRLAWSVRPASLLMLAPEIDWAWTGASLDLGGSLRLSGNRVALTTSGQVMSAAVNPWLASYDLNMAGSFQVSDLYLHMTGNRPDDTRGTLDWSGGRLHYALSGQHRVVRLPPLQARLSFTDGPSATVFAEGNATPLLEAKLLTSGYVYIGITKLLTRMLDDPWPGGAADHEVVVAVEEKIL